MKQSQNVHRQKYPLAWVRRHPVASVFALWVTLLLLAGLSTATLVNVNNSVESKMTQIPSTEPSNSEIVPTQYHTAQQNEPALPWLSLGAIALTCTLGCLILSQTLRSTGYQSVQRKTSKIKSASLPLSAQPDRQKSLDTASSDSPSRSQPTSSSVASVTVVPKQQNHPLDWDEPSLADSLDLRQRRPLSHWL
jgi:hypothetical protein